MTREKIIELAKLLGAREIADGDDWVSFNCPFARWRHSGGRDENPSFGVIVDSRSSYHCFSCGVRGRLATLPSALAKYGYPNVAELRRFIFKFESYSKEEKKVSEKPKLLQALPESILDGFRKFKKWGVINEESIEKWELRFDPRTFSIVFPVRDRFGRIVGLRRRFRDGRKFEDKQFTPFPLKKAGIWYGIHLVQADRPIYLVEGERDAILLHQVGVNAMASLGSSISRAQIETLSELGAPVVCFFDNDKAGRQATQRVIGNVRCPVSSVLYWGVGDPAEAVEKGRIGKIIPIDKSK